MNDMTQGYQRIYTMALANAARALCASEAEAKAILDVCNGLHLSLATHEGELLGQHLRAEVQDGIALNGLDLKWPIDGKGFVRRLRDLSRLQSAAIELWAAEFWASENFNDPEYEREHVAKLARAGEVGWRT